MPFRTYRFTITGELTIDDTALKTVMLSFEQRDTESSPPLDEEENLHRQAKFIQKPPVDQMRAYLQARHFRVLAPVIVAQLDKDMPGIGYQLDQVNVEEIAIGYGPGDREWFRPVRPEDH